MTDALRTLIDHATSKIGQPYNWSGPIDPSTLDDAQPLIDFHRQHFGDARMEGEGGGGEGGAGGAGGGEGGGAGGSGNTYTPPATQADLDRLVSDRLARERQKYADHEQFKASHEELQKLKDGQKSEVERLTAERDKATKDAQAAADRAKQSLRQAAVIAEAAKAGAVDPQAVAALLPADAVTVADDGTVSGAESAVKTLLEEKSYLKSKQTRTGPPNHGQGSRENGAPERGAAGRAEAQKRFGDKSKA